METGSRQRRQSRPKSVTVAEIDGWFRDYVDTDKRSTTLADVGEAVELPCDLSTALELWAAFHDHGILPRSGGYLEQPRWFRNLLRFLNSRHAPISAAYMAAKYPSEGKSDGADTTNWIESGDDMGTPFDFERLKQ